MHNWGGKLYIVKISGHVLFVLLMLPCEFFSSVDKPSRRFLSSHPKSRNFNSITLWFWRVSNEGLEGDSSFSGGKTKAHDKERDQGDEDLVGGEDEGDEGETKAAEGGDQGGERGKRKSYDCVLSSLGGGGAVIS